MCGRYYIDDEETNLEIRSIIDQLNRKYGYTEEFALMKTGEIFPTEIAPIIRAEGSDIAPALGKWGFPKWQGNGVVINARAETAMEKRMFSPGLRSRRCAIPTTGFFEWKTIPGQKKKDKYLFTLPDSEVLYLAGIYNETASLSTLPQYVILTTAANESMEPYHNRMPVLLTKAELKPWIIDNTATKGYLYRPQSGLVAEPFGATQVSFYG